MENMTQKPDAVELKPCPFCGGTAFLHNDMDNDTTMWWYVSCSQCINQTTHFCAGRDIVIARWNTRDTAELDALRREVEAGKQIDGSTSDGHHTFDELYEYRKLYNAALFNEWWALRETLYGFQFNVHKSKRHSDGELCFGGGWFIVQATLPTGQISNHYKLDDWDLFKCEEREQADTYDGHSPSDVAVRLAQFLALEGESR